jgi:hypothetical protein
MEQPFDAHPSGGSTKANRKCRWSPPSVEQCVVQQEPQAKKEVERYLKAFDHMGENDEDMTAGLASLQRLCKLPESGKYDQATKDIMSKPRCGVKPPVSKPTGSEPFRTAPGKWDHTDLTYRFVKFSRDLPEDDQKRMIERSFQQWAKVTPLSFTEVSTSADIDILFAPAEHGDGDPFDGPAGVLAHAFFPPPNGGRIAGDMHFDEDEKWNDPFLHQVALHELGHSLGLRHSEVEDAVMFEWFAPKSELHPDDIAGIQSKYGKGTPALERKSGKTGPTEWVVVNPLP